MGEGVSLTLCTGITLTAGTQYCFSLDLITRANFGNSAGTSRLRIYGSSSTCQTTQLLWDSPSLTGQWQTYNFCFTPTGNWNVISFRVVNAQGGFTSVGVDRWLSTDGLFPPSEEVPDPVTSFSYVTPLCVGGVSESPTLSNGFTSGGTFTSTTGLSINGTTGVINVGASTPGSYTVTYSIPAGACSPGGSSTAQVTIVGDSSASVSYPGGPYCTNEASVAPQITGASGGVYSATAGLSINAQTGVIEPVLSQPGSYTVSYTLTPPPPCAPFTTTAQVVIQGPQAAFQANPASGAPPLNVTLVNGSTGQGLSFDWTWPGGSSAEENPIVTFPEAGTYVIELVVTDQFGCSSSASAQVVVSDTPVPVLVIPNVFTPNGDGPNDRYRLTTAGLTYLNMEIYNRWGQVVGRLVRPDDSWDGRSNSGEPVPEGTYFHHLTVRDPVNGERTFSGHITLLR
jgi:gliding motility-associated-like protein